MSNAKFIADWNDIFDHKIKESDLQKPTELFVFNVLVDYLKKFSMDCAALINHKNSPNPEMRRQFRARFCAYIDHIYKISCAANNFVYYDFIKPSPKKTTHMLKVLLNYYLYVEMLKKETVTLADAKIKERNRLLDKKTNYHLEVEAYKRQLNEIQERIAKYKDTLPKLKEQAEALASKEKAQAEKIAQLQDTIRNYDAILNQLKCKEDELKCDLVSEEEIESIAANKAVLEQAISEQEEIERITLANSKDRVKLLNKMQTSIEKIEITMKSYPLEDLNPLREMKASLQQMYNQLASQKAINDKKKNTIETNLEMMHKYEIIMRQKKDILLDIEGKAVETLHIKKNIENEEMIYEDLTGTLQSLEKELQEQNELGDFILGSVQSVVDALCDS
ncbi:unnamed protein product [Hermetia illucens]|uniref:Kinetochore protein Nuf2 N-terminal domain-containing protein n=2 Tax=Hermetia illucens TaxID=343691 RepID=A0A7R8UDP0_HERIL|nr:probable kinetochore protein NUF2 isoform X1 [Hermetia illucens]CAD7078865.1 unnamed protein product [Hermetia illucens]